VIKVVVAVVVFAALIFLGNFVVIGDGTTAIFYIIPLGAIISYLLGEKLTREKIPAYSDSLTPVITDSEQGHRAPQMIVAGAVGCLSTAFAAGALILSFLIGYVPAIWAAAIGTLTATLLFWVARPQIPGGHRNAVLVIIAYMAIAVTVFALLILGGVVKDGVS